MVVKRVPGSKKASLGRTAKSNKMFLDWSGFFWTSSTKSILVDWKSRIGKQVCIFSAADVLTLI